MTNALLGIIGGLVLCVLTLLISIVWDIKKESREQRECLDAKQDKEECNRIMDKSEETYKENLSTSEKNLKEQFNLRMNRRGE